MKPSNVRMNLELILEGDGSALTPALSPRRGRNVRHLEGNSDLALDSAVLEMSTSRNERGDTACVSRRAFIALPLLGDTTVELYPAVHSGRL